jgi:hypothetical protein
MNTNGNPGTGWLYSNYNNLYCSNPSMIVQWGSNSFGLSGYQLASSQDSCSVSDTADFVNAVAGDLHLLNTPHNQMFTGLGNAGVASDFDGDPRNNFPAIGADELLLPYQGVSITGFGAFCSGDSAILSSSVGVGIQWYRNATAIAGATTDTLIVTQAGTYYVVLPNGCLTDTSNMISVGAVSTINDTVVQNGLTLSSLQSSASWVWIDCSNNLPIPGATGQNFTPAQDGNYAVIIFYNGCVDTSDCFSYIVFGVPSLNAISATAFPNPGSDKLTISLSTFLRNGSIVVTNALGQTIKQIDNVTGETFKVDVKSLSAGIYFVEIKDRERSCRLKWMKVP